MSMILRIGRGTWWGGLVVWLGLNGFVLALAHGADATAVMRDTLAYKDGDRVQGTLVREADGVIVFKADRFGELRVPAADAVVIKADKPTAPAPAAAAPAVAAATPPPEKKAAAVAEAKTAATRAEEEKASVWERFSPSVLTAKVRDFFGPWHGRLALSTEVVSDSADRYSYALDGNLHRKWERDEVQLNGRFDYAETNHVNTTDTIRSSGSWRHDFNKRQFTQYRPTVEWNRASLRAGVPNDYVLLQQEIGVGLSLITTPTRKLRAGVSQNLFDVWNSAPTADHSSRGAQSTFEEAELTLPWRMTLTQRGVWYPVPNQVDGWENRVELNKKLTETLSASVRHEIRRNNPDGSSQDYTRLKLMVGLDF